MISIRQETEKDRDAVRNVTTQAFASSDLGHNGEADLIQSLRDGDRSLSLVALEGNRIVGHILFTPAYVATNGDKFEGMALGPMAVAPSDQQHGIGSALIRSGLQQLKNSFQPFVLVLGHPQYYPRFGFEAASRYGIAHGFEGIPQDVFLIIVFNQNLLPSIRNGKAFYRPDFGPQHGLKNE